MKKDKMIEVLKYVIIIAIVILIRTFIATPIRVNGTSMDPTLKDGEIMILNKYNYRFNDIQRFDIVVIKFENEHLIKRVIGLPGDTLEFKDNNLFINGKLVKEKYLKESTEDFNITRLGYEKIPNNCYFVMGDNRSDSIDSRYFGCFEKEDILGNTNIVIFPFNKIGKKE